MNEYLSPDSIAKILETDPSTVRRWCKEGTLPYSKFGRLVRIKSIDFERFLKDNEV